MRKRMKISLFVLFFIGIVPARAGFFGWLDLAALVIVIRTAERIILHKNNCCVCCYDCKKKECVNCHNIGMKEKTSLSGKMPGRVNINGGMTQRLKLPLRTAGENEVEIHT